MDNSSATEQIIQSFLNRSNNDLKDEKTYSIDSAIWYSTAYLNYTYAIYDSSLIYLKLDTTYFNIDLDNNRVNESDLLDAIDEMVDSLAAFFEDVPTNPKHVIYCMVYEISVGVGGLDVGLVSVVGCGFSSVYYSSFGEEDYWFAILDYGMCEDSIGQYEGEDAADQLEYKIMHPLVVNDPDYRIYIVPGTDEFFEMVDPYDYEYLNSPRGYRAYYYRDNISWPGPQCCDPDELNFYLSSDGIYYIINDKKPEGLNLTCINIIDELFWYGGWYYEEHFLNLTYSETYQTVVQASEL